jgi:histidyl-tRNA synthetase
MGRPKKNANSTSGYVPKKIQGLDGLIDITGETDCLWGMLLRKASSLSRTYGFERVELPFLEDMRLYEQYYKGSPKQLASAVTADLSGKTAVVRTDFLPSVLRAYYQHKTFDKSPLSKWSFSGFTVTQDQKQALSSEYNLGFEVFGQFNHLTEAQIIGGVWEFLATLGLKDCVLEINNIGTQECQNSYSQTLLDFLSPKKYQLCDDCSEHLDGRILNVFRCVNLDCQTLISEAPAILDFLDEVSRKHFTNILEALDELSIPYQLNPLYAGPGGFGRTNLVIKHKTKTETLILGEGGYHEQIMQGLCGKAHPCFGFVLSLSKIHYILESNKVTTTREQKNDVFLVPLGELAAKKALRLFKDLSGEKVSVYDHFGSAGVKNQLKQAETYHAPIALIMGQKEAMDEMVILRDVRSGMQEVISYDKIVQEVKKRLGR